MSAFELLSYQVKKYIRDRRWESLRPIQIVAIEKIITTDSNYIIASKTASGKTEAAFLPLLSIIDPSKDGIQILYISPLKALINDQFARIEELSSYLDVEVTKWHGESSKNLKNKLIKNPRGILLITPESLEAMFVHKGYLIDVLFKNLQFIVIDEIHYFLGTDRGVQLKSLLMRIKSKINKTFRFIGLSATLGDFNQVKDFLGEPLRTKILLDKTKKNVEVRFKYFNEETSEYSSYLIDSLLKEVQNKKTLIFPNSRGKTEEIAVKLKILSQKKGIELATFSHHSSIEKELREYIETFAKNSINSNYAICCTSTLELGIDIGGVDQIIQVDSTTTISSLIQRTGRSGRKNDQNSRLILFATNEWSLLQSLACWLLYTEGFIEPPIENRYPVDILAHQILSIIKGYNGITFQTLLELLDSNITFNMINLQKKKEIIRYLTAENFIEQIGNELILGTDGERIVNNKEFYSVFTTERNLKVIYGNNRVGEFADSPQLIVGENIYLAAKIWKIIEIDIESSKIYVIPALDGKAPIYSGGIQDINECIRLKMLQVLSSLENYEFLDSFSQQKICELRKEFLLYKIKLPANFRPVILTNDQIELYTFTSSRINRGIYLVLKFLSIQCAYCERKSMFKIRMPIDDFTKLWSSFNYIDRFADETRQFLLQNPFIIPFKKYSGFLSIEDQIELALLNYYDIECTLNYIKDIEFYII